jgi:hypothetical protein
MAWGTNGHRIAAKLPIATLPQKPARLSQAILGTESIAMTSNWADFIKSDPQYKYLSSWHYVDFDKQYTYPEMQAF